MIVVIFFVFFVSLVFFVVTPFGPSEWLEQHPWAREQ
jgi:hypothetical protein